MSTLEIDSIRNYLIEVGCKVEYPILVNAFKKHLYNPDPNIQGKVRTQFKDYVNRLATVNVENNMKFITLRPEFRPISTTQDQQQHLLHQQQASSLRQNHQQNSQLPIVQPTAISSPNRLHEKISAPSSPARLTTQSNQEQISRFRERQPSEQSLDPQDSPRLHHVHLKSHDQVCLPRLQHQQSSPLPPPIPQHHRQSLQVMEKVRQEQQQQEQSKQVYKETKILNSPRDRDGQHHQGFKSPPNQHHFRSQSQPMSRQQLLMRPEQQQQQQVQLKPRQQSSQPILTHNKNNGRDQFDGSSSPFVPPAVKQNQISSQSFLDRQSSSLQSLNTHNSIMSNNGQLQGEGQLMPPPRPPPRRRQSTASLFKTSPMKSIEKIGREMHDLARKNISGRVKEHASRFNSSASTNDLSALTPKRNSSMKENRLSRDSSTFGSLSSALQRNGSHLTNRSRSSHRGEDESDSSSLQPIDPLRRRWVIEACSCNYNDLLVLLREDPKLAPYKDIINGYTALHWAAKFGNLNIIKLIAGTYGVSANMKSSAGHTPLHVAYMFNRVEAANLLLHSYKANPEIRDHYGRKPAQYLGKLSAVSKT